MIFTNTKVIAECEGQHESVFVCVKCGKTHPGPDSNHHCCDLRMILRRNLDDWLWNGANGMAVKQRFIYVFCKTGLMLDWEFWHE